ncbi:MAG: ADP-ribosylglycohydrolase family protein [Planctomycetota bacterium]|jgi:ADP-ribosylglycohydrolase
MSQPLQRRNRFRGVLLGTAVGDSIGLPAEGLSRRRAARLFPGRWRQRLLPGSGLVSDDTEHTVFVAQSLLAHPEAPSRFLRRLAWCLRLWLVSLPAGIGFATLRSILRLWVGFPPHCSGVRSAGNGPAMRAAPIGAFFADRPPELDAYVSASTRLTHTDPRAFTGARAVALLVAWCVRDAPVDRPDPQGFAELLRDAGDDQEWRTVVDAVAEAARRDLTVDELAGSLGPSGKVSGYIYHTVPVAAYGWYRHFGDFEKTLTAVLDCGGDTDTTGAIVGALAGAVVGDEGIPGDWVSGLRDWPRGTKLLLEIADRLDATAGGQREAATSSAHPGPVRYFWPALAPRNLLLLVFVLLHGLRRLAPPY